MSSQNIAVGPPMIIGRGYQFVIAGQRFRTSQRAQYEIPAESALVIRIGLPGSEALIDQALDPDETIPTDVSYFTTLEPATTLIPASDGYQYLYVQTPEEIPLEYGPCSVVDLPNPIPSP